VPDFFADVPSSIPFGGLDSRDPLAFKVYQPDRIVLGKRMEDHLRPGVCFWHSFAWGGVDMFGLGTLDRPWLTFSDDGMAAARTKMAAAFEFFSKLGIPYYCFHDRDVAPEGDSFAEFRLNLDALADDAAGYQERTGTRLLWGTANLFSDPRYQAGAATNPDPDVFAYAAAQVKHMLEVTLRLGGENYVLWGGREGYDTLLNTDLRREQAQLARFLHLVAEHKAKIGFTGQLLIEPKPMEPTKHQYDYDVATVFGFLQRFGLEKEVKLNIEVGHAYLAGHSFEHELAVATALGVFGSIDSNRNDLQSGWDTDQFPNNVPETALAMYYILKAGGFTTGGTNFDSKLRRQSLDPEDLIAAHVGAMDVCARGLLAAEAMIADGGMETMLAERYAGWKAPEAQAMLTSDLATIAERVERDGLDPQPRSGKQEKLENWVNRFV
jgi:xylose isomerase